MRKQTTPRTRKRQLRSTRPKDAGLTAREKNPSRSARSGSALDNRSHRTTCASAARPCGGRREARVETYLAPAEALRAWSAASACYAAPLRDRRVRGWTRLVSWLIHDCNIAFMRIRYHVPSRAL